LRHLGTPKGANGRREPSLRFRAVRRRRLALSPSPRQRQRMAVKGVCMKSARKPEPPLPRLNDPEYWRGRAEEARAIGERMIDGEARASLFRVTEQYEELGRKAGQRRIGAA
jgi:hypothetical protein